MNTSKPDPVDIALSKLSVVIKALDPKPKKLITDWLMSWAKLLAREKLFDPTYLPYYKRGDIVYIDLGFNIGSEHGGIHYAAVYENNNSKKNKNVVIIPLSSVDDEKKVSTTDIYLGEDVIPWTPGVKTIAKVNQIRSVSKMRILKPLLAKDKKTRLKTEHLNLIDNKLKELLLKPDENILT